MQQFEQPRSRVGEIGVHIPERVVDNAEMANLVKGPDRLKRSLPDIIARTTGNHNRVYAAEGTVPSDLAVAAIFDLVKRASLDINTVDTLIFASTDMDMMEPATANIVQERLGLKCVNSFDVSNACNSFLQAMNIGNSLIATGAARRVLICSGELGSVVCNREVADVKELRTKMGGLTLGDAGAALLLEPADNGIGLTEINLMTYGEHWRLCHVPEKEEWRQNGGAINPWFYLDMPALAKIARRYSLRYFQDYERIRRDHFGEKDFAASLDFFVPHQISRKLIEEVCLQDMKMPTDKVVITADIYGNTASTAIPLAMRRIMDKGELLLGSGAECFLYGAASGFGMGHIRLRF
ncbi:beta-ketoacyl-ACP reductase [Coraliomargarita sinensis]|uniref:Beta-ketoacyl-ACP reductase n=2 Tax=Coraliomargarita sinensis TaxID=2174842 RepID=A0A317ZI75_9BACT|nr:beta-ketoacyl-ACP reductase [Coraliomargarita sinensis]